MNSEYPDDNDLEEFEKEFSSEADSYMDSDNPWMALGAFTIGIGSIAVIIMWILSLMEVLRH